MPLGSSASKSTMIDKVYTLRVAVPVAGVDFTGAKLSGAIPDGAKILSMKATNLHGRYIQLTVPSGSALMLTQDIAAAPLPELSRFNIAPLSRFPVVKVNVPDLIARPVDTGGSESLFKVITDNSSVSDLTVLLRFHVKIAI